MDNLYIIGIVASIVGAGLFAFLVRIYQKIILPYYYQISYKGISLTGNWISYYDNNQPSGNPNQNITVIQKGVILNGSIKIQTWADGSAANEEMRFQGSIRGEKLFLTYEDVKRPNISFGALILQIQDNGQRLVGYIVGLEPTDLRIYSVRREWTRASQ